VKYIVSLILIQLLSICPVYGQSALLPGIPAYYSRWGVHAAQQDKVPQFADSLFFFRNADNKNPALIIAPFKGHGYNTATGYYERNSVPIYPLVYVNQRKPIFSLHGNVVYELYYQSNADTPYVQRDVYQHTLQTSLVLTYKDKYPLRINFTTRKGNSSLFRNLTDFNLQFTNRDFRDMVLKKAAGYDWGKYTQQRDLENQRLRIEQKQLELDQLKGWSTDPGNLQKLIEAREHVYYARIRDSLARVKSVKAGNVLVWNGPNRGALQLPDSIVNRTGRNKARADSLLMALNDRYEKAGRRIDSLEEELAVLQASYDQHIHSYGDKRAALMDVLTHSRNNKELAENLKGMNLPDSILPKGYKQLLAIKSVGIGRTIVNHSELTAKNISILGVQAEYNPSYYIAFATGKVDYRFRDFIYNDNRSNQYLNLMRVGWGMTEGNNVILSYYTGRKQVYNYSTADGINTDSTSLEQHIMGFSLEGKWQIGLNNSITGEVARSTFPSYARLGSDHSSSLGTLFGMGNHSNEAYSVKGTSYIPYTGMKIEAMYKMMGANFQSFSLYTTGSSQTAWSVKVDQPFFKQQLMVTVGVRKNDYNTNYRQMNFSSNAVFKSMQATLRMKKWPVLSLGYFPSTQLTRLSDKSYAENNFYTLSGSLSHFYQLRGMSMSTVLTYTQFYNKQEDSTFLYYNSRNIQLMHNILLCGFTIGGGGSIATTPDYDLYSADGNLQYKVNRWLELGGGLKYNWQTAYNIRQVGYSGNARVVIPKVGEIAVYVEKAFIPSVERRLVSSNNGRVTYTKTF